MHFFVRLNWVFFVFFFVCGFFEEGGDGGCVVNFAQNQVNGIWYIEPEISIRGIILHDPKLV